MTRERLEELFESNDDEFLKFDRIKQPIYPGTLRPDLYAFNLLDALVPGTQDMVSGAEHDEIFLDVDLDKLADKILDWQVIDLIRCGVRFVSEYDSLAMFA